MKKTMSKNLTLRTGGIVVLLVLLLVVMGIVFATIAYLGYDQQNRQTVLLGEGYQQFQDGKFEEAFKQFQTAEQTFSATLGLYRKIKSSDTYVTADDLNELIISTCIAAAYEDLFALKSSEEWLNRAKKSLESLKASERKTELSKTIATAQASSQLCKTFNEGDMEKTMKGLLATEKEALSTDQDFFIFEIRLLIACGKKLNDQDVINQARELLFFATTDAGINNDKTGKLWILLTN